jgi:8-oxo-dGTP diphosphatase
MSEYPRPIITADVIIWHQAADGTKHVALILRGKEPFKDHFALPGGHFNPTDTEDTKQDKSIIYAGARELSEELNIVLEESDLWFFDYFDEPGRDPRGRYITFVFTYKANSLLPLSPGDDAKGGKWFAEHELKELPLAFDHARILQTFFEIAKDD